MHVHVHVCARTYVHVCVHICACVYACVRAHMCTCVRAHMYVCAFVCAYVHVCTCVRLHVCVHVNGREWGWEPEHEFWVRIFQEAAAPRWLSVRLCGPHLNRRGAGRDGLCAPLEARARTRTDAWLWAPPSEVGVHTRA